MSHHDERVVDGWATDTRSDTPLWLKLGIGSISAIVVISLVAGLVGPFLFSGGNDGTSSIEYQTARVVEVLDVRTIVVEIDGELAEVRYIGVDPLPIDDAWHEVGVLANRQLVEQSEVTLEADAIDKDDFGRLLRYVYSNGSLVNALLVRNGVALVAESKQGLDRYGSQFNAWSDAARREGLGFWGDSPPPSLGAPSSN